MAESESKPETNGTDADTWRELIKPVFMEMHRRGIATLNLVRDGGKCQLSMTLDMAPVPELADDDDLDDDDFEDDDFDYEGPGEGPLEYLERTAPK